MAAVRQRLTEEKADWVIYVTDMGQSQHFKAVFKAARMAGWLPAEGSTDGPKVDHVGFGLVLGEDGKRLRTRNATDVRPHTLHSNKLRSFLNCCLSAGSGYQKNIPNWPKNLSPFNGTECFCGVQNVRLVELLDEARDTCATTIRARREESGEAVDEV